MNRSFRIPIVVFHHVTPDLDYYTNLVPAQFEKVIGWLSASYTLITLSEAADAFETGVEMTRAVVVTFDDGYLDNYIYARPILARYGARATFFVLPAFVGKYNTWNTKCGYCRPHMNWSHLRVLMRDGHEIGSHGITHRRFPELLPIQLREELAESQDWLQRMLDTAVTSLAYPYGVTSTATAEQAATVYRVAVSTIKSKRTDWCRGVHDLRRIYCPSDATEEGIMSRVASYTLEDSE